MTRHDSTATHFEGRKRQKMAHILARVRTIGTFLLLAILPLHAFIATTAKTLITNPTLFTLLITWKELLAISLLVVMGIEILLNWQEQRQKKLDQIDILIVLYTLIALIFAATQHTSLAQWAFGIRIDVLPFICILFFRRVRWPNVQKLLTAVLAVGVLTAIFGIAQSVLLPESWLATIGYSQNTYITVPGAGVIATGTTTAALSSCPLLEHTSDFCRAISTFGGPTRFGVYMLVIIGLILGLRKTEKDHTNRALWGGALLICSIAAFLTFSRSVWIGLLAMLCVWSLLRWGKRALAVGAVSIVVVGAIGIFALSLKDSSQHQNPLKSILTRSGSSSKHLEYARNGVAALIQNPLGRGVGTVGPAADRYTPFLTENWFLQIFVEMGVAGGVAFLLFIGALMQALYKTKTPLSQGVLLGLIGVCVAGLFTHSFEELAAGYTLMILSGLLLADSQEVAAR